MPRQRHARVVMPSTSIKAREAGGGVIAQRLAVIERSRGQIDPCAYVSFTEREMASISVGDVNMLRPALHDLKPW